MRTFDTGATRHSDADKLDFEGFLSPSVLTRFATYLHKHRVQADGKVRASDNWQKGIPKDVYLKSAFRHFMAWWLAHRTGQTDEEALCALLFNVQGYLHEVLKCQAASTSQGALKVEDGSSPLRVFWSEPGTSSSQRG